MLICQFAQLTFVHGGVDDLFSQVTMGHDVLYSPAQNRGDYNSKQHPVGLLVNVLLAARPSGLSFSVHIPDIRAVITRFLLRLSAFFKHFNVCSCN